MFGGHALNMKKIDMEDDIDGQILARANNTLVSSNNESLDVVKIRNVC